MCQQQKDWTAWYWNWYCHDTWRYHGNAIYWYLFDTGIETLVLTILIEVSPVSHSTISYRTFRRSLSSSRAPSDHMIAKTISCLRWLELMSLLSSLTGISPSSRSSAWRTYMHSNSWNVRHHASAMHFTNSGDRRPCHPRKFLTQSSQKCCRVSKIKENVSQTEGKSFQWKSMTTVTICFVILQNQTTVVYRSSSTQFQKYVITSMLPGQQCAGNSAYLLTSRGAVWIKSVQVFCVEI